MARWLFKQEPTCYSFADLERDGKTLWDGISNALALQHLRKVKKGDRILFYHTGKEKAIVGEMAQPAMRGRRKRVLNLPWWTWKTSAAWPIPSPWPASRPRHLLPI